MDKAWNQLVRAQISSLGSCPVCPVKGTCVFITPGYEPGYCLHEYRRVHALMARRLREHPPAGASEYVRLAEEANLLLERTRRAAFDPSSLHGPTLEGMDLGQSTLARFWPN